MLAFRHEYSSPFQGTGASKVQLATAHSQLYRSYKVFPTLRYQTDLTITNDRGHKFPPSLTLLSSKTLIEWPPVLPAAASFPRVFVQLVQYLRQHPGFSTHRAALMTQTDLNFQRFL